MPAERSMPLYDSQGVLLGVFIPVAHWTRLAPALREQLLATPREAETIREPIDDWETLLKVWDFPYPVDFDVTCPKCGNATINWQQDSPRRFFLKAANIGGLVAFECAQCHARVRKNHFKDGIDVSCTPFKT